eukprot:scpid40966/ scgid26898/ 
MAYPKLSPSASGADRGIFPVKSLLDFKDYRSCVSAPTSPTAQRMLVGSSRAPMDPLSPRRQSCSSEYMSTPDVVGVRERRSHSLFETLDTNTILSARLRNLHIDLERLRADDRDLQDILTNLSIAVQNLAQEMAYFVPCTNLAAIHSSFKTSVSLPTATRSPMSRIGTPLKSATPIVKTPSKSSCSSSQSSPTVPVHLEIGHRRLIKISDSTSFDPNSIPTQWSFLDEEYEDTFSVGSGGPLGQPRMEPLASSPSRSCPGSRPGSVERSAGPVSDPGDLLLNFGQQAQFDSKGEQPKKKRALFTALREPSRDRQMTEEPKDTTGPNSLIRKLLRRTPNKSPTRGSSLPADDDHQCQQALSVSALASERHSFAGLDSSMSDDSPEHKALQARKHSLDNIHEGNNSAVFSPGLLESYATSLQGGLSRSGSISVRKPEKRLSIMGRSRKSTMSQTSQSISPRSRSGTMPSLKTRASKHQQQQPPH